jgi:peptide chain release factor 1
MFEEELASFRERYQKLSDDLSQPEVATDIDTFRRLNREFSWVSKVLRQLEEYCAVEGQLRDAEEMLETEDDEEMLEMARAEAKDLEAKKEALYERVVEVLVPPDENDAKNAILEIRAGTGGHEAALFAGELYRMYSRYAEEQGWRMAITDIHEGEVGGYKEIIALIEGEGVYGRLRFESGTHRVQRIPVTEASGRIHTSAVTVAVLPESEAVEFEINENDLRIDVFRSSGPGGQSVNTTDSAVRITHLPTGVIVTCQDEKSQHKNKAKALRVLRSRLMQAAREEYEQEIAGQRRQQVGSGDRSEKIRTYNFPQGRVTDHRIELSLYRLPVILDGDLDEFTEKLATWNRKLKIQAALEK